MDEKQQDYETLKQYLPGLEPEMPESYWRLAEIFQYQVFELCSRENDKDYYIPYMMNDALECYLILKDCRMLGSYIHAEKCTCSGELIREAGQQKLRQGLIVRQKGGNTFTLWFTEIQQILNAYSYHAIGHFWVKGQEHWRQLVYQIGTMHDKYEYLGEAVCNLREQELLHLVEFPPFRRWSPVEDSLEEKYPGTYEGINCMEQLAEEAKDRRYLFWIRLYRHIPCRLLEDKLSRMLLKPGREALYRLLVQKVRQASEGYPKRHYSEKIEEQISSERQEVHRRLTEIGFQGRYPSYVYEDAGRVVELTAAEEHPFTILEAEDFSFRIQFLLCVRRKQHRGKSRNPGICRRWVESDLGFLQKGG